MGQSSDVDGQPGGELGTRMTPVINNRVREEIARIEIAHFLQKYL